MKKTIITLVPEDKVNDVISGVEEITGDLDKKQGGCHQAGGG